MENISLLLVEDEFQNGIIRVLIQIFLNNYYLMISPEQTEPNPFYESKNLCNFEII